MLNSKKILVSTTSSIGGVKILKHIEPISSHIVLGTNVFSDFLGSFTDVFGGQSSSYQKKLNAIYKDAISNIKESCLKAGGNCVLGLKIDIDEISGKGKSMFMITAIGTAVIVENINKTDKTQENISEKISVDEINNLRYKNSIVKSANNNKLNLKNDIWNFITANRMIEVFPFLLRKFSSLIVESYPKTDVDEFKEKLKIYIENLEKNHAYEYLYSFIISQGNEKTILRISEIIKELYLLNFDNIIKLLEDSNLEKKKIGLLISTFDKPHYGFKDIQGFKKLINTIEESFPKRGEKTVKKQMLSSKEKAVWICECSKTNDDENKYCSSCGRNIYGFKNTELKPNEVIVYLEEKIELISEFTK